MSSGRKSSVALLATAVFAVAIPTFSSAVRAGNTWTGGHGTSTSWAQALNWSGGTLPTLGTTSELVFGSAGFARPVSFIGANTTVGALTFNSNVNTAAVAINLWGFPAGQAASTLTLGGTSAPGAINVDSGATQNITLGGTTSPVGSFALGANLSVNHNSSSSLLLVNRPFTGAFGVTKTGVGTFQSAAYHTFTGPATINGGRWIFSAFPVDAGTAGADLSASSSVVLDGGTMEVQGPNFTSFAKTFSIPFTVSAPSTLAYNNLNPSTSRILTLSGTAAFALNSDLTIANSSTYSATLANGINIQRTVTGTGRIIVSTQNNIASSTDSATLQRVQLTGDSPLWSGGLWVARGTAVINAPTNANPAGTGPITIGTTGSTFGAGLGFNQGVNISVTLNNEIIVRGGGFRIIRNNGEFSTFITLSGPVKLEGDVTIDHTLGSGRWLTLSGNISGPGGINVTRGGGAAAAGSGVRLSGTNTYLGATSVATTAALYIDGSVTSSINVATGALIGGEGSTTGNVTIGAGGTVSFDGTTTNHFTAAGTIDTTAGATTQITVQQAVPALSGTGIVVLEAGSLATNGVSDFSLVGRGSLSVVGSQLLYNYAGGDVVWAGANATNPSFWDINTTSNNFRLGGVNNFFFPQDNVLFDDTASNFNPAAQVAISAGTLTFDNSTNAYTVSLAAVSSTGIVKNGTNSVTLNNDNNVAGSIAVNAGTLVVNATLSYSGTATVAGGQLVANTPLRPVTGSLVVTGPGAAVLSAASTPLAGSGHTVAGEFASVSVSAGGSVTVSPFSRAANKASVLVTSALNLSGGTLDLGTSDMVVKGGAAGLATLQTYVADYLLSGGTNGLGSSSASPGAAPYTTLGVIANGDFGLPLFATFDGVAVDVNDALVKYTYVGDTDLNGILDATDFNAVLFGFTNGLGGWHNGDVNYDNAVNATDWALFIDAYTWYGTSGTPLGGGAAGGAIPEPAAVGLLFGGASVLLRRARR
jgi:fibronectin-binding autotransporter adhesin